jgi:hypothetical protein
MRGSYLARKEGWLPWRFGLSAVMKFDSMGGAVPRLSGWTNGTTIGSGCLLWGKVASWWVRRIDGGVVAQLGIGERGKWTPMVKLTKVAKGAAHDRGRVPVHYTYRCGVLDIQGHRRACLIPWCSGRATATGRF